MRLAELKTSVRTASIKFSLKLLLLVVCEFNDAVDRERIY